MVCHIPPLRSDELLRAGSLMILVSQGQIFRCALRLWCRRRRRSTISCENFLLNSDMPSRWRSVPKLHGMSPRSVICDAS